jgi:GPH family glycoside/pentoside/hexuronide:cation symporter
MASATQNAGMFSGAFFNSRIKSANVQNRERWLGFFLGPALVATVNGFCGGGYLNMFYTDVLKMSALGGGLFLTMMPIISKILDAITNIVMGRIIDRTRSRQGKVRPWILISGPLLVVSVILLFTIPRAGMNVQAIWVMVSYNLYFCIAYTMFNISNVLMVPLSTRNMKQRDGLAMFATVGANQISGAFSALFFPMVLLPLMGADQEKWITVMSVVAILALPGVALQYYFSRERVTEEANVSGMETASHSLTAQMKGCLSSKYWRLIIAWLTIVNIVLTYQLTAILYYCNWVLGTYNDGRTLATLNVIGQGPLGIGVFLLWPMVRKFGKRNCMLMGTVVVIIGSIICLFNPRSLNILLMGMAIKSIGLLPSTYTGTAMLADSLDHVEWKNGFRCDGFSASVYSIILTVGIGIGIGLFNLGLGRVGYIPPAADGSWVPQNSGTQNFFIFGMFGLTIICNVIYLVIFTFYTVEKELPKIRTDITARLKAEAEARGEAFVSVEEKAKAEQEEQERVAELKRIEELKAKCARKGLSFETEEAKYQAKLAAKAARAKVKKHV